jgi:hypothetical protein
MEALDVQPFPQGRCYIPCPKHSNSQEQEDGVLEPRERLSLICFILLRLLVVWCKYDWPSNAFIDRAALALKRLVGLFGIGFPEQGADLVDGGSGLHGLDDVTTHSSRAIVVALVVEKEEVVRIHTENSASRREVNTSTASSQSSARLIHFVDATLLLCCSVDPSGLGRIIPPSALT